MKSCKEVFIDQKFFEFRKENHRWWKIIESSHRVVKYIALDNEPMGWLGAMVRECAVSKGVHEFLRTRRIGDTVLMVRKGHNYNGNFMSLLEFGRDKRRGLIVVPEGRKGEGWRNFGDTLMELHASSGLCKRTRALCVVQADNLKMNRGDGGGVPSYSEVL
ncbi:transcription factor Pur-alpha 1-like [Juglans regia]|uniref:Transcription factor Pur-alpha 1-like n=1 Tax=Juglans regia TaxID=51240 RepID=A0A6P9EPT9_JUGRE|nr:transcription factor Pur-alpha 1-like [Juglans regia]